MRPTITLYRTAKGWMCRTTETDVIALFGTDTLPTPFTTAMPAAQVLARIQHLNPQCIVVLEPRLQPQS